MQVEPQFSRRRILSAALVMAASAVVLPLPGGTVAQSQEGVAESHVTVPSLAKEAPPDEPPP